LGLEGGHGGEGPTGPAVALVLHGGHLAGRDPVHGGVVLLLLVEVDGGQIDLIQHLRLLVGEVGLHELVLGEVHELVGGHGVGGLGVGVVGLDHDGVLLEHLQSVIFVFSI